MSLRRPKFCICESRSRLVPYCKPCIAGLKRMGIIPQSEASSPVASATPAR